MDGGITAAYCHAGVSGSRAAAPTREELIAEDVRDLHRLGYAQQLFREMGGFSNFAISFSIISILTGAVLLYGYGLKFAGPIVNSVGWPLVSLFTLCVAASMAEIASAYPTAGGLYFWAFRLGGTRLGVDDGVAEHDRAGDDHRRHQHRRGDLSDRRGHAHLRHAGRRRCPLGHELVLPALRHGR